MHICSGIGSFLCVILLHLNSTVLITIKSIFKGSNTEKVIINPMFVALTWQNGFILQISN